MLGLPKVPPLTHDCGALGLLPTPAVICWVTKPLPTVVVPPGPSGSGTHVATSIWSPLEGNETFCVELSPIQFVWIVQGSVVDARPRLQEPSPQLPGLEATSCAAAPCARHIFLIRLPRTETPTPVTGTACEEPEGPVPSVRLPASPLS